MRKRILTKEQMRKRIIKPKKLKLRCPNCGKIVEKSKYSREWCDCNPKAPFRMETYDTPFDKWLDRLFKK